jgi:hypothetical protein
MNVDGYVGADEADALAFAALKAASAPMPPEDRPWVGASNVRVAFGWKGERLADLVVVFRSFCATWVRTSRSVTRAEGPDAIVEAAARAWVKRCDAALAWADAKGTQIKVEGLDVAVPGRLVSGVAVCSVQDLAAAMGAKTEFGEDAEVQVVSLDAVSVRLLIGLLTAEVGDRSVDLAFPSLQVSDKVTLCDAKGVVALLRRKG